VTFVGVQGLHPAYLAIALSSLDQLRKLDPILNTDFNKVNDRDVMDSPCFHG
jgi:hypothetical protein